jgi:large subunit ribosomal protein L2
VESRGRGPIPAQENQKEGEQWGSRENGTSPHLRKEERGNSGKVWKSRGSRERSQKRMKKIGMRKKGGRNHHGKITVRYRGGGFKRKYRELEYREGDHVQEISGKITGIEYDPNRTAYIAACTSNGRNYYKIAGGITKPTIGTELKVVTVGTVPVGGTIYNVSLRAGTPGQIARTRGASCKIVKQEEKTTVIRMPSAEIKRINNKNTCQEGEVYGEPQERRGTAGAHRREGVRPRVRGVAMNPSDHPNGGKTHSGKIKNRWGKLAK